MRSPVFIIISIFLFIACQKTVKEYVCQPCNLACDTITFGHPGQCPHCQMPLVLKSSIFTELSVNEIELKAGSGVFLIEGGKGKEDKIIKVFYHQPKNFDKDSKILIVIPGAGRNGDSYRDAWVEASEKHNVLILAPMYKDEDYPFEAYHLAGIIKNPNFSTVVSFEEGSNIARLDEANFQFESNLSSDTWLFNDFDRLFNLVVKASGSTQKQYDIFGHSAGAQILHRSALLHPGNKANNIIAANAGFYTLPDSDLALPFGIKELQIEETNLRSAFQQKLILLIGEEDNETEQGGTLLRSPTVDLQGLHRLARAQFFYKKAEEKATLMGTDFNWKMIIVPKVGHEHRKMGVAAARHLYGTSKNK